MPNDFYGIERAVHPGSRSPWRPIDSFPSMDGIAAGGTTYAKLRTQMHDTLTFESIQNVCGRNDIPIDGQRVDSAGWPKREASARAEDG